MQGEYREKFALTLLSRSLSSAKIAWKHAAFLRNNINITKNVFTNAYNLSASCSFCSFPT